MNATAPPRRWHYALMATAWTGFAVYGSLVPLQYRHVALDDALEQFRHLPPLWFGMGTRADWVANILLFVPLTFLWMGALACDRRPVARLAAALALLPAAGAAAVALEFTQIWFVGRTVSRNDVVAENIGAMLGVLSWFAVGPRVTAWARSYRRQTHPRSRLLWLLEAYITGFVLWSVMPLDLTISVTELYHKYSRGQVVLVPFGYGYESWSDAAYHFFADVAVFVPVGLRVAITRASSPPGVSAVRVALVRGTVFAAALEFVQLLVSSRFTDTTDILLGAFGSALGGWIVERQTQSVRALASLSSRPAGSPFQRAVPWLLAVVGYSVFLAVGFLFPFDITFDRAVIVSRYHAFFRVPFDALYRGNEFNALQQLLVRLLLFAPLGAMCGRLALLTRTRPQKSLAMMTGAIYYTAVASGIEAAQLLMPSKIADLTEVFLCVAGAVIGQFFGAAGIGLTRDATPEPPKP